MQPSALYLDVTQSKCLLCNYYSDNHEDGYVSVHTLDNSVLVKGIDRNRAVEGDVVAVELLDKSQWSAPSGVY